MRQALVGGVLRRTRHVALAVLLGLVTIGLGVPAGLPANASGGGKSTPASDCSKRVSEALAALARLPRPLPAGTLEAEYQKIQAVIELCKSERGLVASEIDLLGKVRDALLEGQSIEACKAKVDRLRRLRAKGHEHVPEARFVNQLRIWRAVFGDLKNERKAQVGPVGKHGYNPRARYDSQPFNEQTMRFAENGGNGHGDGGREGGRRHSAKDDHDDDGSGLPRTFYHSCDATWFFINNCHGDRSSGDTVKTLPKADAGKDTPDSTYCIVQRSATGTATVEGKDICGYDPSPDGDKAIAVEYGCADKWGGWNRQATVVTASTTKIHLVCQYPPPPEVVKLKPMSPIESWEAYLLSEPCSIEAKKLKECQALGGDMAKINADPMCKKMHTLGLL